MIRRLHQDVIKKLNKPSSVYTVGPDNCDFTSLVEALDNGVEGDMFIVFGGYMTANLIYGKTSLFIASEKLY
jgi:hypothetical protein